MPTGYTWVDIQPKIEEKKLTELESLELELNAAISERDECNEVIKGYTDKIIKWEKKIDEKEIEREELEKKIISLQTKINEKRGDKAQKMIEELNKLGFEVFRKDEIEKVNFTFPNIDPLFGLTGKLLFNGEEISNKFHKDNFDQLLNKKLTLTRIKAEEVDGDSVMANWIKEHRFDGTAGVDPRLLEQRIEVSFLTPQKTVSFKETVILQLSKLVRQYDNNDLTPFYILEFTMREFKEYRQT